MSGFLALVVVFALAACENPSSGGAAADPRTAFGSALTTLAEETAVIYHLAEGAAFTVTAKGLAHGTLPLRNQQVSALHAGGDLYLRAPSDYWRGQGMSEGRAAEYGMRWARSVLAFDPGWALVPATVAQALRAAVSPATPASRITLANGLDVFDAAGLRVSAEPPYRVISFAPTLLGPGVVQVFGDDEIGVRGLAPGELTGLRTAFDGAVDSLGRPFVAGPVVAAGVTDNSLNCTAAGACTDTVRVSNRLVGHAPEASARLVLRSSVSSNRLGAQECGQEVVAPLDEETTMACSVRFTLPRLSGTATVSAVPTVTAEPVAQTDPAAFKQDAATELGS
ncbi:hypothetical protein [Amycolatopsis alkalitolerans]|uniref:hypothetical protein n=1 Tax=Amycolatopsis alkalitolerans TaxID=2547244 RepID=UPI001F474F26|nr:hypothetical protein [Amycolatopsis alkalitolerans]